MPDRLLAENILRTAAPRATVPLEGVEQAMLGRIDQGRLQALIGTLEDVRGAGG